MKRPLLRSPDLFETWAGIAPKQRPWDAYSIEHPDSADEAISLDLTPEDRAAVSQRLSKVWLVAEGLLSDRSYAVFCLRMLTDLTLEQVGQMLRVSANRVRQVEQGAIQKVRLGCPKHE